MSLHVDLAPAGARPLQYDVNPYLEGPYEAVHDERTVPLRVLEGTLPDDLDGVYVRNGPNPQHHPIGRYHWFDGDGMVHGVHFADGQATYRNRWVRTTGFVQERDAGRAIHQGILEPFAANPDGREKDTANTDVIFHRDRLLALWYRCGAPYGLDPVTLDDLGPQDFGGTLRGEMSAHAKVDEATGELLFFDYGITAPYLRYGVIGPDGTLAHFTGIDIPGPRLPHDMAITERYSVLMDLPLYAEPEAAKAGRHKLFFDRELPARFAVLPRYGAAAEVRWFEAAPCYIYHVINAWEEGEAIVMDVCRVKQPRAVRKEDGPLAALLTYLRLDAHIHRYRFDLATGRTHEQVVDDDNTEFPSIRQDRMGRRTRTTYTMHISPEKTLLFDGLQKYDTQTGNAETYWFGEGRWGSEAPFAPRPGSTAEDDGYLVSYVYDERERSSELHVLDAAAVTAGPLCRLGTALLLLGDRATLLILRNAFLLHTRRFADWHAQLHMSESVLADRLARLVEARVLERVAVRGGRHEYRLTRRGLDLWVLLVALVEWEGTWSPAGGLQPPLHHRRCGSETRPRLICGRDGAPIGPGATTVEITEPGAVAGALPPRVRRRSDKPDPAQPELALTETIGVIGDRWSAVLVGLALTGVRRFADFERAMGASPAVLADRLRRLTAAGILHAVVPPGGRRADYGLTAKGLALMPFYTLLVAWSDRWLARSGPRVLRIRHGRHDLQPRLACSVCGAILERREVAYVREGVRAVAPGAAA